MVEYGENGRTNDDRILRYLQEEGVEDAKIDALINLRNEYEVEIWPLEGRDDLLRVGDTQYSDITSALQHPEFYDEPEEDHQQFSERLATDGGKEVDSNQESEEVENLLNGGSWRVERGL